MITKDVNRLLGDGISRTVAQIAQALNLTERQAWSAVGQLRRRGGRLVSLPTFYTLTERGLEAAAKKEKTSAELRARQSAYERARRLRKALAKKALPVIVDDLDDFPRPPVEAIVECAIASRPALQMAWGAVHEPA